MLVVPGTGGQSGTLMAREQKADLASCLDQTAFVASLTWDMKQPMGGKKWAGTGGGVVRAPFPDAPRLPSGLL